MKDFFLKVKAIINKRNRQINVSLPKKEIPDKILKKIIADKKFIMRLAFD